VSTIFTAPGKLGDALHQWPIAYHWFKKTGEKFDVWLDEKTCAQLVTLFQAQPCANEVKLVGGVENWSCGGQPFHMNLPTSAFTGNTIYHLGLRGFPNRQLTLQCKNDSKVPLDVDVETLTNEPSLVVERLMPVNRLVVHGQGVCPHNRSTPTVWKFLSGIKKEVEKLFDEVVFVGSADDLEVARIAYPNAKTFEDDGNFLKLAEYINQSRAMIGCGSAPIVLAGLLKVPSIRVHDPIGNDAPKVIWNNLAPNSINETEIELRTEWPKFRDKWLVSQEAAV
jgi:hypothetical protein